MKNISIFTSILFSLLILSSCVGTLTETALPKSKISEGDKEQIVFGGVYRADAISHDKIEVLFYPAKGGSARFTYSIYAGDSSVITVPSEVLIPDYRGLLKYTITGLQTGKQYVIKIEAQDQISGGKDVNIVTKAVSTFLIPVCDFQGIGSVSNPSGVDGLDSITVRWAHARVNYSSVAPGTAPTDPHHYEIVLVDSTNGLTPSDMDDENKGTSQGRFVKNVTYTLEVNETVVRGLKPDTKYWVRVRAVHNASNPDPNDKTLRSELNTNIIQIKTLTAQLSAINFNQNGLVITKTTGNAQETSVALNWPTISGVFHHLRVYYAQNQSQVASVDVSDCKIYETRGCKKLEPNITNTIIANLEPNKDYYFRMVVCQLELCTTNIMGQIKTGTTRPTIASFSGLTQASAAQAISDIGKIFLTFPAPNLSEGNFHGYHVRYRPSDTQDPQILNLPTYNGSLKVEPFDYILDTQIVISNVDYTLGSNYCFEVYPFVYDSTVTDPAQSALPANQKYRSFPNGIWKCVRAEILRPDVIQFPGFLGGTISGNNIEVTWDTPMGGIFDQYEIFVKRTDGGFSFATAKFQIDGGDTTTYYKIPVTPEQNRFILNLPSGPGARYRIGILTSYSFLPPLGLPRIYYSEDNQAVLLCDLSGTNDTCSFP